MSAAGVMSPNESQKLMRDVINSRSVPSGYKVPWSANPVQVLGAFTPVAYGAASQVLIVEYQVKVNWVALFTGLVLGWQASGGPAPLPGDLIYTIDIDKPLGATGVGYTEKDFAAVQLPLGSVVPGLPWPVQLLHSSGEHLRVKGYATANVPVGVGSGSFLVAALLGFTWPNQGWE
jgi:hypothetical protein